MLCKAAGLGQQIDAWWEIELKIHLLTQMIQGGDQVGRQESFGLQPPQEVEGAEASRRMPAAPIVLGRDQGGGAAGTDSRQPFLAAKASLLCSPHFSLKLPLPIHHIHYSGWTPE